ncbi:DUF1766-domain-containing protein [Rhizodiscina lignyota]|uniref:DUF1766-domain-containing protein n=1 Tax=Rhizodiscina lignyota TaxID=1504668 RepID=A0A9P4I779_9PEZI|nr:DUF1766-domain-containing protein [Rhizodiscina lignyota]
MDAPQTPDRRPALSNRAVNSTLPLDSFDTPDSQRSTYFDSEIWDQNSPRVNDGPISPFTPPTTVDSKPSPPSRVGHSGEDEDVRVRQIKPEPEDNDINQFIESENTCDKSENPKKSAFVSNATDADWRNAFETPSKSSGASYRNLRSTKQRQAAVFGLSSASGSRGSPSPIGRSTLTRTWNPTIGLKFADKEVSTVQSDASTTVESEHVTANIEFSVVETSNANFEQQIEIPLSIFEIDLIKILPPEFNKRLYERSNKCCASKVDKIRRRCKRPVCSDTEICDSQLESLSSSEPLLDIPRTLSTVRSLVHATFCNGRKGHKRIAEELLNKLEVELERLRNAWPKDPNELELMNGKLDRNLETFSLWIKTLSGTYVHTKVGVTESIQEATVRDEDSGTESKASISSAVRFAQSISVSADSGHPAASRNASGDQRSEPKLTASVKSYIQKFERYSTKETRQYAPSELVLRRILAPLSKTELKSGTIYMYWFPPNFGLVKIGVTRRKAEKRISEWEKVCEHRIEDCMKETPFEHVQHARRVEKLIHAELQEFRRQATCRGCGRNHREWFDTHKAEGVIRKWLAWITTAPYEEVVGPEGEKHWRLRASLSVKALEHIVPVKA